MLCFQLMDPGGQIIEFLFWFASLKSFLLQFLAENLIKGIFQGNDVLFSGWCFASGGFDILPRIAVAWSRAIQTALQLSIPFCLDGKSNPAQLLLQSCILLLLESDSHQSLLVFIGQIEIDPFQHLNSSGHDSSTRRGYSIVSYRLVLKRGSHPHR